MTKPRHYRWVYIGDGAAVPNIPARSLSPEESHALDPEQAAAVKSSGLYDWQELIADPTPAAEENE